jgi:hypothetical protein
MLQSMEIADARKAVDDLRAEITATESRLAALRKLVDGYHQLFPALEPDAASEEAPKGQDAARRVLTDSPGQWFTVAEILEQLTHRGWLPDSEDPANAVRTALTRLQAADPEHIVKGTKGGGLAYAVRPPSPLTPPRAPVFTVRRTSTQIPGAS